MSNSSRRAFLKNAGRLTVYSPVFARTALFNAIISNLVSQAWADATDTYAPVNYLNIHGGGGSMRYCFDHWLRTNKEDPAVVVCAQNATNFTYDSSRNANGYEYRTHEYNGVLVPHIFFTLPEAMRNAILNEFLVIRGYGEDGGGHGQNSLRQQHPLGSAPSIAGLLADKSSSPFGAVQMRKTKPFASQTGLSPNVVNPSNPLDSLLSPLITSSSLRNKTQDYKQEFEDVRRALASVKSEYKAANIANGNIKKALDLFNSSLGSFESEWASLVAKYEIAMTSIARQAFIPGLNATFDGTQNISHVVPADDSRYDSDIGASGAGTNLCATNESMPIDLATTFALAEFGFKNKLFTTLQSAFTGVDLTLNPGAANPTLFDFNNDAHGGGGRVAMVAYNFFHRGFAAGMYEFRNAMVAAGLWQDTLIHYTSEFDRTISKKETGSGHGTTQMITSVFSGRISNGPYCVGNIGTPADKPDSDKVSQAWGVPIDGYDENRPTCIAMASTLTEIFGSENPWKSFYAPLVKRNANGTLTLPFGKGKVILNES